MLHKPEPGTGLIFMKVGVHARESLEDILERKKKELRDTGLSFWGYGGSTCHPAYKVRPFVERHAASGKSIYLCMQKMVSGHSADPVRAEEFSKDGVEWVKVPPGINVLGSRYALVLKTIEPADFLIDLAETRVGIGPKEGRSGAEYIQGRVDKACLEIARTPELVATNRSVKIELAAELASPYAVLLR